MQAQALLCDPPTVETPRLPQRQVRDGSRGFDGHALRDHSDYAVVKAGSKMKFWVSAWAGTEPVIIKEGATWTATAGSALSAPMPATGLSTEFTAAAMGSAPADAVQAAFGQRHLHGQAQVVAAPAMGRQRLAATHELTGRPISGARAIISDAAGAEIAQPAPVETNAAGVGNYVFGAATQYSVTVFHADFTFVTIANYRPSGPDANVLNVVLRRNPVNKFGGYKGTFDGYPMNANIKAGVGGMSLAGAVHQPQPHPAARPLAPHAHQARHDD